jgi:hypothetical protein
MQKFQIIFFSRGKLLSRKKGESSKIFFLFKINYSADSCLSHQGTTVFSSWGGVWGKGQVGGVNNIMFSAKHEDG